MNEVVETRRQQVTVNGYTVALVTGIRDGVPFIQLDPINCKLEGEEPGLYFLVEA